MSAKPVQVQGLGKRYKLGGAEGVSSYGQLAELFTRRMGRGHSADIDQTFWALREIDFEIDAGEKFAIIGHNGAGKSTLLKILSRIVNPTEGSVRLRGRVGALIEVGTGFHPELTGRENVYLNGALLGMGRTEITSKFEQIVDFADIGGRFIDTPVKRYSSGMLLRLAFAVSAHLETEILIIDEVLSVGDLSFQEKCLGRVREAADEGRTVLFVSHNLTSVQALCERGILLSGGRTVAHGTTEEVIGEYVRSVKTSAATNLADRKDRTGDGRLRFTSIHFESGGEIIDTPITGQDLEVVLGYETADGKPLKHVNFQAPILTNLDVVMIHLHSESSGAIFSEIPGRGQIRCRVPRLPIPAGEYLMTVWADIGGQVLDWVLGAAEITVAQGDYFGSGRTIPTSHQSVLVDNTWSIDREEDIPHRPPATALRGHSAKPVG